MKSRDLDKYLGKALLRPVLPEMTKQFRHFAVIPVMDELDELPATLQSIAAARRESDGDIGVILVVNHGPGTAPERKANNLELLRRLAAGAPRETGGLTPGRELFWIDAASPGRELTRGVGEARRIGLDTALAHLDRATIGEALLFSLDADSHVAPDYFSRVTDFFAGHPACGAVSIAVRHRPGADPAEERAIRAYERYMEDFVARLRAAGSPYAFLTIGSAFAVRAAAYVAAGGMRVRPGAEDFHFLQAVRKTAPVGELGIPLVFPAARPSDRVPFGTGPAVRAQLDGQPLPAYADAGFAALAALLAAAADETLRHPAAFRNRLSPELGRFLDQHGFFPAWEKVLAQLPPRPGAATAAFHRWFDGLKTLQLIRSFGEGSKLF